jgi:serine/threonine protein kinase
MRSGYPEKLGSSKCHQVGSRVETIENIFPIMKHVNCDLLDCNLGDGHPEEEEARRLFYQVACALEKGITHKDLKLENILVDGRGNNSSVTSG